MILGRLKGDGVAMEMKGAAANDIMTGSSVGKGHQSGSMKGGGDADERVTSVFP